MKPAESTASVSLTRRILGWVALVAGCGVPFLIPLVWYTSLSPAWKSSISAFLAFGLPEILIALSAWLMGADRIRRLWQVCMDKLRFDFRRLWRREA